MSTHFGFGCLSHDPALLASPYHPDGLNHGLEALAYALVRHRSSVGWPRVDDGYGYMEPLPVAGPNGQTTTMPIEFLDQHPRCHIVIHSEYGDSWVVRADGTTLQVSGSDDRKSAHPVRDAAGQSTGVWASGVYPPEGESRCSCIAPTLWVTHPRLSPQEGWVRCSACGGTSLPSERVD